MMLRTGPPQARECRECGCCYRLSNSNNLLRRVSLFLMWWTVPLRWKAGVALDHRTLHLDGAPHSVDHAAKLNNTSVPGALHYAPVMYGDGRID